MKYRKIISTFCLFSLVFLTFSPIFANKAEAQWTVFDPANFAVNTVTAVNTTLTGVNTTAGSVKEFGLDTIAYIIANMILERIAASTVSWINSGFKGNPSFLTRPEQFYGNLADGVAGQLIYSNPNFRFMCSPFRAKVQIAINKSYLNTGQFQCSLTKIGKNFDAFMQDFNQGGWEGFIELTQNSSNNPIGLYNSWNNEITTSIAKKTNLKEQELFQGNGHLSFKKCTISHGVSQSGSSAPDYSEYDDCLSSGDHQGDVSYCEENFPPTDVPVGSTAPPPIGDVPDYAGEYTDATGGDGGYETCTTETPGSVISAQLNSVLHTGNSRLEVADEINEIISALLNQLVSKALGGLRSLGGSDSGNNNHSYLHELEDATTNDQNSNNAVSGANAAVGAGNNTINNTNPLNNTTPCRLADGSIGISTGGGPCTNQLSTGGTGTGGGNNPFPITASDGSIINSGPTDLNCANTSIDTIITVATDYKNSSGTGIPISSIVENLTCASDGTPIPPIH